MEQAITIERDHHDSPRSRAGRFLHTDGSHTLLVIDDDDGARALARAVHERAGWSVLEAPDVREGLRLLYDRRPQLILLDVAMEPVDGFRALARIRELTDVPVMMVSGRTAQPEKVRAFHAGADDYVTKPYGLEEIVARSEALVRRAAGHAERAGGAAYDDGVLALDPRTQCVTVEDRPVSLTPLEYRLLSAFVRHPRHVLTHTQLLELAWGSRIGTREQVKVYVGYLRRKLAAAGGQIRTVRGFGYSFDPAAEDVAAVPRQDATAAK